MTEVTVIMASLYAVQEEPFAFFLQDLLDTHGQDKSTLYEYLFEQGYAIEKTSMYRYFNLNPDVNRIPDPEFIDHLAAFLALSDEQRLSLHLLRQMKRRRWQLPLAG